MQIYLRNRKHYSWVTWLRKIEWKTSRSFLAFLFFPQCEAGRVKKKKRNRLRKLYRKRNKLKLLNLIINKQKNLRLKRWEMRRSSSKFNIITHYTTTQNKRRELKQTTFQTYEIDWSSGKPTKNSSLSPPFVCLTIYINW